MLIISVSIMAKIKNKLISITITFLLLLSVISVANNLNYSQSAFAQNTPSVGTFSASGYTGQTFVLPGLILTPTQQKPPVGSVLGGNWSFAVNGGKLQQFQWIGQAYTLTGKVNETLSINGMTNASNFDILQPLSSGPIKLAGNGTVFKGNVNIILNDRTIWTNVPAIVTLSNGKLIALQIGHEETNGAFTIPLFGVVTSLSPQKTSSVSTSNNFNGSQIAAAQSINSNNVGSFSASGYTGQTFVLPSDIIQPPPSAISQFKLSPPAGSIISGNWSFAVNGGKLQDFKWNVELITLNGKVNGTASITGISNSTGIVGSLTNNNIQLSASNGTAFKANADININDRTSFYDVPIVLYLLNGKLVNLSIDSIRTGGLFTTPLFGIVTTLTH
jgi:hypothetical protein